VDVVVLDDEIAATLAVTPFDLDLAAGSLEATRRERDAAYARLRRSPDVERVDHVVVDDPRVVVRVHRPKGVDGILPCIYSIHGGGYLFGTYAMDDLKFDAWCPGLPCVGVTVDYRLAPETPYPGPLEDCYAGLAWTFEHADELGIAPDRIGVTGSSAGGGLAAALALLARDRGELDVAFQLLECPMLDDRQTTSSSRRDGLPVWSREANEVGWKAYLGERYGGDVPAYAAPARATDLSNLPPAMVIVGTADGFRDEDVDYALRLNQAGVPTELHVLAGAPHGIRSFARTAITRRWLGLVDDWLARTLVGG
jgi:acetyl esterase/lipase